MRRPLSLPSHPSSGFVRAGLLALWCCVAAPALGEVGIGNLVFVDANGNGVADAGEGRAGVTVQLFQDGQSPTVAAPTAEMETDENGFFLFDGLTAGTPYFLHVPAVEFQAGGALAGMQSVPGVDSRESADDNQGEDGADRLDAAATGLNSRVVIVEQGGAPLAESGLGGNMDAGRDADVDLTVDLGFYRPMAVGNLVFLDANGNGRADPGEGVNGVQVQLYRAEQTPGVDAPENETVTSADGRYLLDGLFPDAGYYLHIPASEFGPGRPLEGALSVSGADAGVADDDAGEDGLDAGTPAVNGVSTAVFTLPGGDGAPTEAAGETGFLADADDAEDGRTDLTRDFGFVPAAGKVGVGNLIYVDDNGDGFAQPGEGWNGVIVRLYEAGSDPASDDPVAETMTTDGGRYFFGNLDPGAYFLFLPAYQFLPSGVLARCTPLAVTAGTDDNAGQDALPALAPDQTGVRTGDFTLAVGTAPTAAGFETGVGAAADDAQDADVDLTVDLGFLRGDSLSVGNLVFVDANANGSADAGEGRAGVTVQLFREGDAPAVVSPLAEVGTAAEGRFQFTGLAPGRYFLRVPPAQFQSGGALQGAQSITGAGADNGVDDDDNGADAPEPAVTGVQSVGFELAAGSEPVNAGTETGIGAEMDDFADANGDVTLDLGFVEGCPLVTIQPLESAEAWRNVDFQHFFSVQGGTGPYSFALVGDLPPGLVFEEWGEIWGTPQELGEFTFYVGALDAMGCNGTLEVTLTVAEPPANLALGNTVFADLNGNGRYDAGEGVPGVTVALVPMLEGQPTSTTVSAEDGHYLFENLSPGNYLLRVPAAMFAQGAPLYRMKSLTGVDGGFDDDVGEDGHDAEDPSATGVETDVLVLMPGQAPTADSGETGRAAASDDGQDDRVDLTRDFGFLSARPRSFLAWQAETGLGGALENPDGDLYANLLEYALALPGDTALEAETAPRLVWNSAGQRFDFEFHRRLGGLQDVSVILEHWRPNEAGFAPLALVPVVTAASGGLEKVVFEGVEQQASALGDTNGFVRLRVVVEGQASSVTPAWSWHRRTVEAGAPTAFSMPLVLPEVFAGPVTAVAGAVLDVAAAVGAESSLSASLEPGRSYYVEVLEGVHEGGRWEVDEAACTAGGIALDMASAMNTSAALPDLAGALLALRPHWRLDEVAPPELFSGSNRQSDADRVQRFEPSTSGFTDFWLRQSGGQKTWVQAGDATLADQGGTLIANGQGVFLRPRTGASAPGHAGRVRVNDFRLRLGTGTSFVGAGWPLPLSMNDIQAGTASGFRASNRQKQADRLRLWQRGGGGEQGGSYTGFFLHPGGGQEKWVLEADASLDSFSDNILLMPFDAVFFVTGGELDSWRMPTPAAFREAFAP